MSAGKHRNSFVSGLLIVFVACFLCPLRVGAGRNNGENILLFWTGQGGLKAVTLMCVRDPCSPVGIVGIPVDIRISKGGTGPTIAEAFRAVGRQGLTAMLEERFEVNIDGYLLVDQSTLDKLSRIVGPVVMGDRVATMSEVFEGTYTEDEIEPQSEIRLLAAQLVKPQVLVKAPQLVCIFSSEVKTNLGIKSVWNIYRAVERQGPGILRKKALTGRYCHAGDRRYREVPQEAWVKVLNEVTRI
ncbi:MAG TPA: hypothetical protein PK728_03490 [Bacillota bacterium]|nr:hypothetical protein [Bacillota bacterium]